MRVIAAIIIITSLIIGIVPQFTDCESQGRTLELANGRTVAMKCHWTARSEIAVATPLLLIGAAIFGYGGSEWRSRKTMMRMLGVLGVVMGVFAVLMPTALIGVCMSADMLCNSLMRPTLIFSGTLAAVAGLAAIVLSRRD